RRGAAGHLSAGHKYGAPARGAGHRTGDRGHDRGTRGGRHRRAGARGSQSVVPRGAHACDAADLTGPDQMPAGGHTPMMIAITSTVTSSCAMFSVVSFVERPSKASCVMNRAAVNPAHNVTPVTTADQK